MTLYYVLLSGLHASLPFAELEALLDCYANDYEILSTHDLVVLFSSRDLRVDDARKIVLDSGMINEIGFLLFHSEAEPRRFLEKLEAADLGKKLRRYGFTDPFAIRFTRVKNHGRKLEARFFIDALAEKLLSELEWRVDLDNPSTILRLIATEGMIIAGVKIIDKKERRLYERRPRARPFFKPGALSPQLSRVFVNLSRPCLMKGYLDPFCGTGGFVIEAFMEGITDLICMDADRVMVKGSRINLRHYGVEVSDIIHGDAGTMPFRDSISYNIGTDPPYGRSTPVKHEQKYLLDLLKNFLAEAERVLKKESYLVFAHPSWINPLELLEGTRFKLIRAYYMRVHKSLTRVIVVTKRV